MHYSALLFYMKTITLSSFSLTCSAARNAKGSPAFSVQIAVSCAEMSLISESEAKGASMTKAGAPEEG
eukprot:m.58516 g.58516  ORF g.58516 m.58516 type:complete len:68 (+) comp11183_c0_seq1:1033-1236(+)